MTHRVKHHHHHLASDLHTALGRCPRDAHLKDAIVAFLARALPLCDDPVHHLCQRVRSAATRIRLNDDND